METMETKKGMPVLDPDPAAAEAKKAEEAARQAAEAKKAEETRREQVRKDQAPAGDLSPWIIVATAIAAIVGVCGCVMAFIG